MKFDSLLDNKDNILEISTTRESVDATDRHPVKQLPAKKTKLSRVKEG